MPASEAAGRLLLLDENEVRSALSMTDCIEAVEGALASYSTGAAELPGVISLAIPEREAEIHVKAGYLHGSPIYATKFASGFPQNAEVGLRTSDGLVVVFDAATGTPAAFLIDHGAITDIRTGAAGGVAARWLAPERVGLVAVLGTGEQARQQLDALAVVRPDFAEVRIWGRDAERSRACVADLRRRGRLPEGCVVRPADSPEDAARDADVVITCTASTEPLVRAADLAPSAHITALGSDGPGKQELDPDVLGAADVLVVDSREQCARLGELQHALQAGVILAASAAAELGEVIAGRAAGRTSADQLTVCDLTGVGVQDVVAARLVLERAAARGLGRTISL